MFTPPPMIDIRPNVSDDTLAIGEFKNYVAELLRDIPDDTIVTLGNNNAEALARGLLALEAWVRGFRGNQK